MKTKRLSSSTGALIGALSGLTLGLGLLVAPPAEAGFSFGGWRGGGWFSNGEKCATNNLSCAAGKNDCKMTGSGDDKTCSDDQ